MSYSLCSGSLHSAVTQLLNNAFPKVTFKPETLRRPGFGTSSTIPAIHPFETPLFALRGTVGNYTIQYDHKRYASIMCMRYFADIRDGQQEFNGETNTIPVRWFHVLKEVYFPEFEFEVMPVDYTEEVKAMPDMVLRTIVEDALHGHRRGGVSLLVTAPDWKSGNVIGSTFTEEFFAACKRANYKCLDGRYKCLPASEGGIEYFNSYVDDFIRLNHKFVMGSIRNETKGHRYYHLTKDICHEELAVLSILLTKHGIEHTFTVKK